MSIVKHLNGNIPIIPSNYYHHSDSCFKNSLNKNSKNSDKFPEDFIDIKRFYKQQVNSLQKTRNKSTLKVDHLTPYSRFDSSFSYITNSVENKIFDTSILNSISFLSNKNSIGKTINKSMILEENGLKYEKIRNLQENHDTNLTNRKNDISIDMNLRNFKERLKFLKNNEINVRKNNFWNNVVILGNKVSEESQMLKGLYSEKELKKLIEQNHRISKLNKSPTNLKKFYINSVKLKPILREDVTDMKTFHLKYKKNAKSLAVAQQDFTKIHVLIEKIMKNIKKLDSLSI